MTFEPPIEELLEIEETIGHEFVNRGLVTRCNDPPELLA